MEGSVHMILKTKWQVSDTNDFYIIGLSISFYIKCT